MQQNVFITRSASYLPNGPISNDQIEDFLGLVGNVRSRAKNIVLRQNGIKTRYYALNTKQQMTHTNAEMGKESIVRLFDNDFSIENLEVLSCATSTPDQLLPSQASMIHGLVKGHEIELFSHSGVCLTSLQALKTAYMCIRSGLNHNAICCASELPSAILLSKNFNTEYEVLSKVEEHPIIAFHKDFLRFMLSDGASSVLLEAEPRGMVSLKIEWIEMTSFAHILPTCMRQGGILKEDGELISWKAFTSEEWAAESIFTICQDVKVLNKNGIPYFAKQINDSLVKHGVESKEITYILPHISSMYFKQPLIDQLEGTSTPFIEDQFFLNLPQVGNVGSASIFLALDELMKSGRLQKGDKILLAVPESGRFSYGTALLTVY